MNLNSALVDGGFVKAGDGVGFKDGYEQYGEVAKITRGSWGIMLTIDMYNSTTGDNYTVQQRAEDCWKN
jgi:hypothetical protein